VGHPFDTIKVSLVIAGYSADSRRDVSFRRWVVGKAHRSTMRTPRDVQWSLALRQDDGRQGGPTSTIQGCFGAGNIVGHHGLDLDGEVSLDKGFCANCIQLAQLSRFP
jgi:hypothetical protein